LLASDWQSQVRRIGAGLHRGLNPLADQVGVEEVRVLGAIGVVQLDHTADTRALQPLLVEQGIWVRPFANLVYIMPPFVMTDSDLEYLCAGIETAVRTYLISR